MGIVDALDQILQQRRRAGITNKEMATQAGCSQPHINDLLNHTKKKKIKNKNGDIVEKEVSLSDLKFETLLRLFPEVREVLEEHFCKGEGSGAQVVNSVVGNRVGGNITNNAAPPADARLDAALDAVLADPDICDQCRLAVLRHIRAAAHS